MKNTTLLKILIGVVLLVFWIYLSNTLTANPSLTTYVIPFSYGMLALVAIIIQLFLKKDIQSRTQKLLDMEIENRREELVEELNGLVEYLKETKVPCYSDSGVEGLEDNFREFDSIKSKYTFQPKIIYATILIALSSLILFLFWSNPTLWVATATDYPDITLAHIGLGFFSIAIWLLLNIFVTSLEVRIWEKEET
jgi:hypothetical protein